MSRPKFEVGETAQVLCYHLREGHMTHDWLTGTVVQADYRMAAVKFDVAVFANNGWRIPDNVLWCAHGSPHLRRVDEKA